ncbi:UvrD-helicase domain-containing protein [Robertmurraya andreesenii]|uniref:DNA 3'-5' helicase n=1 Tax=Anoxybacillus andreesenii TaxID=1325932 RepID=A0ABT9VAE6_9BACL|nr:ATP-dependent helicase [Robertmurraya andreesenii]MDQ0157906.1 superfamily I DNA/RNA helicase [Robertmurraya andreesenii]
MIKEELWKPTDGIVLEEAAYQVVRSQENTLVIAGPGAGKSELLAQRASYLLETNICKDPQKILAISFKVDAADNLKKRVEKRVGGDLAKRFESRTFDSFAKSILDRFRLTLPSGWRPDAEYNLVFNDREVMDIATGYIKKEHPNFPNWQYEIQKDRLVRSLTKDPLHLLGEREDDLYGWVTKELWKIMIKETSSFQSSLTFPMISRLAEYILNFNSFINTALRLTYSHIFLDEFQDTTYVQYDLLKSAFWGSRSVLTAVGDDKQRIMGWAGAMADSFNAYSSDFNAKGFQLIFNHRSAPRLIEVQNVLSQAISHNTTPVKCTDKWSKDDGVCEVWTFNDYIQEAKHIAKFLSVKLQSINPRDICIIVKQQESVYAKRIIEELQNVGINSRIEKDYQDLLSEEYVQLIVNTLYLTIFKSSPTRWQEVIKLKSELDGIDYNEDLKAMWEIEEDFQNFISRLKGKINSISDIHNEIPQILDEIIDYFSLIKLKNYYPKYLIGNLLKNTREKFHQKIIESYIEHRQWDKAIEDFLGVYSIPIMTIHKSKGLEYECVFFIGLEDDAFWSFRSQSDSDIRAFFVALSRAKREVYFTFSEIREIMKYRKLQTTYQSKSIISSLYDLLVEANVETKNLTKTV